MNLGQVILIIAALVILSFITLSVNSMFLSKTTAILQSEAHLTAISIAQSMIDEVMTTSYDSATVSKKIFDSTKFSPISCFGPETSPGINEVTTVTLPESPDTSVQYKSVTKYNDVDDYNNYRRYYYSRSLGTFAVIDTVFYVIEADPNQISTTPTFFKKVVVTVRHPSLMPPDAGRSYNPWQGGYYLQLSDVAVYRRYF